MNIVPPDLDKETVKAYTTALEAIGTSGIPFLIGGGLAFQHYTGHPRTFNDLDVFCKAGDYPKILQLLEAKGFTTAIQDEKWIAKASKGKAHIDFLFSAPNNLQTVEDSWFKTGQNGQIFGMSVPFLGANELVWSKIYVQNATKFDGPDVYHLILKIGETLDWRGLLSRMEADWEVLLAAIINFRFVFPSNRTIIPGWLMGELLERLERQLAMPIPHDNICRGPLLSRTNYAYDVNEGGFIV